MVNPKCQFMNDALGLDLFSFPISLAIDCLLAACDLPSVAKLIYNSRERILIVRDKSDGLSRICAG